MLFRSMEVNLRMATLLNAGKMALRCLGAEPVSENHMREQLHPRTSCATRPLPTIARGRTGGQGLNANDDGKAAASMRTSFSMAILDRYVQVSTE